jgi:small conductance mechanosensitive channel
LAFGFGGQYLIRDIISGLFILENQYRVGDVSFDNAGGTVQEISLRKTLRDLDGTVHHIPGEIKKVSNLSKDF